jgi:hypothetical protein
MENYRKILVAKKNEKNKCYANDGDILVIASSSDKFKGSLPKNDHFFVSLENRVPSKYGWVKETDKNYTALELARMDYKSKNKREPENDNVFTEEQLNEYENLLKKINKFQNDTPVKLNWNEKMDMNTYKKEKYIWIHKVVFYNPKSKRKIDK